MKHCLAALLPILTIAQLAHADEPIGERIEWADIWVTDADKDDLPRVLLVGDSITRGYFGEVEKHLEGKAYCARLTTSKLRLAVASGGAVTIGLAVSSIATVMHDSQRHLSALGRGLFGAAGTLILIGAIAMVWAVFGVRATFAAIATSAVASTVESVEGLLQATSPKITLGSIAFILGLLILLVAGQVGFWSQPHGLLGRRSILGIMATVVSVVLAAISCLLLITVWLHSNALEGILANSTSAPPKPTDLATHLSGIINGTLIAFVACGFQGIMQAVAGLLAPAPSHGPASDEDI